MAPLNDNQLNIWYKHGYLHLENILSKKEVIKLIQTVDQVIAIKERDANNVRNTGWAHGKEYYNILHALDYTDGLDYLLDHPKTFDIVLFLMGPYIQVMSCDIFVRAPNKSTSDIGRFHTDGGPSIQRILPTPGNLPLQFKLQFFLTDLLVENAGNFTLIPGSHLKHVNYHHKFCYIPHLNQYVEKGEMPPEAIQLKVKAGDVLIHPWSLWHAVSPNKTQTIRKSISIRYGQMWLRPYYQKISSDILNRISLRQKRLLGEFGTNANVDVTYRPPDDQVSLLMGDKASSYGWGS